MKKTLLMMMVLGLSLATSAQLKITFEDDEIGSTGGATAMLGGGTVDVMANTYTNGNASGKVLHVNNTNYLPIYFSNVPIPAGAENTYSTIRVKYLIIGGADTNYPTLEIFSSPNNTTAGATEKIGQLGWESLWGNAEIGIWKTIEFSFANSLLKPVPAGNLILKLSKSNTEYLIDDIELVLTTVSENGVFTVEDFESRAINDVFNMKRYSTTDGSAIVEANPTDAAKKSVHIVCSNWDALLKLNVALPTGKVLADYEKLMFDIYFLSGFSNHYKKMNIYVDGTKVYEDSDNPNQASDATWTTKEYALNDLAGANAFVLDLGLSTDNGNYYIDNVKLMEDGASGIGQIKESQIIVYYADNCIKISDKANQVNVYDLGGNLLKSQKNISIMDISDLNKGLYLVKVFAGEQIHMSKIVK